MVRATARASRRLVNGTTIAFILLLLGPALALGQSDVRPPSWPVVADNFPAGDPFPQQWLPIAGTWSMSGDVYNSTAAVQSAISTLTFYDGLAPDDPGSSTLQYDEFDLRARLRNPRSEAGTLVGVVYHFQDAANFYEAVFSPTGTASIRRMVNGAMSTVVSAPYRGGGAGVWFDVEVHWDNGIATVSVNREPVLSNIVQNEFANGQIGLSSHNTAAKFDKVVVEIPIGDRDFKESFTKGLTVDWSPQSGQWAVAGGTYNNSAVNQTSITLAPIHAEIWDTLGYTLRVRMLNPYGGPGNLMGIVFNYNGPANYDEVVFSPTGVVKHNRITDGVSETLETTTYNGRRNQWFDVALQENFGARISVNGQLLFGHALSHPFQYQVGNVGLITHWTPGKFDDVWFKHGGGIPPCSPTFGGDPPAHEVVSGTWNTTGGTLNDTSAGKTDVARVHCGFGDDGILRARLLNQYGASGNLVGLTYYYQAAGTFYGGDYMEVVFAPTGQAYLNRFIQGVQYRVATGTHSVPANTWFDVEVKRAGIYTTVTVNGTKVFDAVPQAAGGQVGRLSSSSMGAVTHWAKGRFADISTSEFVVR